MEDHKEKENWQLVALLHSKIMEYAIYHHRATWKEIQDILDEIMGRMN